MFKLKDDESDPPEVNESVATVAAESETVTSVAAESETVTSVAAESETVTNVATEGILTGSQCGAWCFIFGVGVAAFCTKPQGHKEKEHETDILVYAEPRAKFKVLWELER